MYRYGILLLCAHLVAGINYPIFVPTETPLHWHPANHSGLICPIRHDSGLKIRDPANIDLEIPHPYENNVSPGHSCHKTRWVTTCDEDWLWRSSVTQTIETVEPSTEECKVAITKKAAGTLIPPFFPSAVCQWNNKIRKVEEFVMVNKKDVRFDPYNLDYMDPLLLTGRCRSVDNSLCRTTQAGVYWIADKAPTKDQNPTTIKAWYGPKNQVTAGSFHIWGNRFPFSRMNDACKMKYGNVDGIRFRNGLWAKPGTASDQSFKTWWDALRTCSAGTEVRLPSAQEELAEVELTLDTLVYSLECINIAERFRETGKISILDLGFFSPTKAGIGNIYRIKNGRLEASMADYVMCFRDSTSVGTPALCIQHETDQSSKALTYQDWVAPNADGLEHGFNGIYRKDGRYYDAFRRMELNVMGDKDRVRHELKQVHHPIMLAPQLMDPGLNWTFSYTGERGEVNIPNLGFMEGLEKFWHIILMTCVAVLFTVGVLFFCCRRPGKKEAPSRKYFD